MPIENSIKRVRDATLRHSFWRILMRAQNRKYGLSGPSFFQELESLHRGGSIKWRLGPAVHHQHPDVAREPAPGSSVSRTRWSSSSMQSQNYLRVAFQVGEGDVKSEYL